MTLLELTNFIDKKMKMTGVYQPVIVRELLQHGGECTKEQLARAISFYDPSVLDYYKRVLMRWPKATLTKHGVVSYKNTGQLFSLNADLSNYELREQAIQLCESKISEWLEKKRHEEKDPVANQSVRYQVLKRARQKCELCGIPAHLRPIDVDHIVPVSKADRDGRVSLNGRRVPVHSVENLQALCSTCNRAKRADDQTDWRRRQSLIRDFAARNSQEESSPKVTGRAKGKKRITALKELLVDEYARYIDTNSIESLADSIEVILSLAETQKVTRDDLLECVDQRRKTMGSFDAGLLADVVHT